MLHSLLVISNGIMAIQVIREMALEVCYIALTHFTIPLALKFRV